jgi:hypothetical protein
LFLLSFQQQPVALRNGLSMAALRKSGLGTVQRRWEGGSGVDGVRVHGDRLMRDAGLGSEARWIAGCYGGERIAGEERNTGSGAARSGVARQHGEEGHGELKATPVIGLRRKSNRGGSAEAGLCGGERDADWFDWWLGTHPAAASRLGGAGCVD